MTAEPVAPPLPVERVAILAVAVTLVAIALAWCFLSMRAVMDVGGACADGGPYISAQPCPNGAWLISIAVPLLLIAAFAGTFSAASLGAPDLLLPMWFLLFASLGANFLDFGFWSDPWQWGYIVCGVVFELMALPALYVLLPIPGTSSWLPPTAKQRGPGVRWWVAYLVLGVGGMVLGYVTFQAAS
jgi:hypothetical protein